MKFPVKVNGKTLTPDEYAEWGKGRVNRLKQAGCMVSSGHAPGIDTDTLHLAINRSGLTYSDRAELAKRAQKLKIPEESCYDPTIPGQTLYETRAQADAQCAAARARAESKGDKPEHRLHPRHVKKIREAMIVENPSLKSKDQRELTEQIIESHSLPKELL